MTPEQWVAEMRKTFKLRVTMTEKAGIIKGKPLPAGFIAHPSPEYLGAKSGKKR
tara:strand:+ start:1547 stop:1708 length:162 start_codon:yes stop_codon:yes gene_type:complete